MSGTLRELAESKLGSAGSLIIPIIAIISEAYGGACPSTTEFAKSSEKDVEDMFPLQKVIKYKSYPPEELGKEVEYSHTINMTSRSLAKDLLAAAREFAKDPKERARKRKSAEKSQSGSDSGSSSDSAFSSVTPKRKHRSRAEKKRKGLLAKSRHRAKKKKGSSPVPPLASALTGLEVKNQNPSAVLAELQTELDQHASGARFAPFPGGPISEDFCNDVSWIHSTPAADVQGLEHFGGFAAFLYCLLQWGIALCCVSPRGSKHGPTAEEQKRGDAPERFFSFGCFLNYIFVILHISGSAREKGAVLAGAYDKVARASWEKQVSSGAWERREFDLPKAMSSVDDSLLSEAKLIVQTQASTKDTAAPRGKGPGKGLSQRSSGFTSHGNPLGSFTPGDPASWAGFCQFWNQGSCSRGNSCNFKHEAPFPFSITPQQSQWPAFSAQQLPKGKGKGYAGKGY